MQYNKKIIYLAGFLFYIPIALASYINSTFISLFTGEKYIGVVYAIGSALSVGALLFAPKILRRLGGYRFLLFVVLLDALSFLGLFLVTDPLLIITIFILGISLNTLIIFSLDEILKIFSENSATGKTRGAYLAICNLAWILAQLGSGTILGGFSFRAIYFLSFMVMILLVLLALFKLKTIPDPKYDHIKSFKYIKNYFQNKNLSRTYVLSFLLQFFFCWMVIYTPIYLFTYIGFSWKELGIIFAIMLIPFSIIPFHLGEYADKIGERRMLMLGFLITSVTTFALFFIHGHILLLWAIILFATRVGASTIEVMSDAYFFKHIKPENEEFIGIFRSASPLAYILGPIIASIIFIFIPYFSYLYVILGAIMLAGIYLSSTIQKTDI